jgi:hypothetical protein
MAYQEDNVRLNEHLNPPEEQFAFHEGREELKALRASGAWKKIVDRIRAKKPAQK